MMQRWLWEGIVTAQSSISHGGEALGVNQYLRREKVYVPPGVFEDIPIISGNSFRGLLRRATADVWWKKMGSPLLTAPVCHAIWSGGALAKATGTTLSGERLREVKKVCPVVEVFGTAGGGRIIDGTLKVGKFVPLSRETRHMIPSRFHDSISEDSSFWDITQIEEYSKTPVAATLGGEKSGTEEEPSPMRFGVETYVAGAQFYTWMSVSWVSESGYALLCEGLQEYLTAPTLGGLSGKGHGMLMFPESLYEETHAATWTPPEIDEARLREVLSWLD